MCFKVCENVKPKRCLSVRLRDAYGYAGYFIMRAWMQNSRASEGQLIKLRLFG